jgi:hypothetical protein
MKKLESGNYRRAREFVMTTARPVDRRLFEWVFEGGRREAVWDELAAFTNADGGFGNGIEPDCRLPASSTLGTITAFPHLVQTGAPADHPLVRNAISYLTSTYDRKLKGWRMLPPEANDHPRAAWWNFDPATADADIRERWLNPSACAAADLFRYSSLVDITFLQEIGAKALSELQAKRGTIEGHDFLAVIEFAEAAPPTMQTNVWPILQARVRAAVATDPSLWSGYGIRPLWAVPDPSSPLLGQLRDAVEAQLDFEIEHQHGDGSWHPFWNWGRFDAEWEKAKVEWQGQLTVKILRSLKAFGRIA